MSLKSILSILASALSAMAAPSREKQIDVVAAVLWAEARSEGSIGLQAVAQVIRNRMNKPDRFGSTAYDVVTRPKQFSCLNHITPDKLIDRARYSSGPDGIYWMYAHYLAACLVGKNYATESMVGEATHYYSGRAPGWMVELDFVTTIGAHHFYK
jgi:N-acetylmuramoyl-L-alanine amidase